MTARPIDVILAFPDDQGLLHPNYETITADQATALRDLLRDSAVTPDAEDRVRVVLVVGRPGRDPLDLRRWVDAETVKRLQAALDDPALLVLEGAR
ncbi:hypothetical protein ACFVH6_22075 [Spirillospora sp. NPDC127200]